MGVANPAEDASGGTRSANVAATPETIWETCFAPMKWETWDPDLKEVIDVTGGCKEGTTCVFVMKNGLNIPIKLTNVTKNKSVTFSGGSQGGILKAKGTMIISPIDLSNSKIDYSFEVKGCLGTIFSELKSEEVVGGTEHQQLTLFAPNHQFRSSRKISFEVKGCLGTIFSKLKSEEVVGGTEHGLANMVKLSEEAQTK